MAFTLWHLDAVSGSPGEERKTYAQLEVFRF
jgi:hypothetical protein